MTVAVTSEGPGAVTEDAFLGGALRLRQPAAGYRAGIDAVLLAAAVPVVAGRGQRVLDAGAGIGTAGLCLARRIADARVVLAEQQPALAAMARDNVALNGLGARVSVVTVDIRERAAVLDAAGLAAESFDHVLANPPYHDTAGGTLPADRVKAGANAMAADDLEQWARFLARVTVASGTVTLIHKAEALGSVLACLARRFGALEVRPIQPRPSSPAIRIIVRGIKGSHAPLTLLPPMVLHGPDGHAFTPEVAAILDPKPG